MLRYPTSLPAPNKTDRAFQMVDPLVSTPFDSGQTRWDRRFTDVPTATPISWIFKDAECQAFEAWYRDQLRDGAEWFEMPIRTPIGRELEECHFTRAYSGPTRLGFDRWRVDGQVLLRRRPLAPPGWGEFPEFLVGARIIDIAINVFWPLSPYDSSTDAPVFDQSINQQWPQEVENP